MNLFKCGGFHREHLVQPRPGTFFCIRIWIVLGGNLFVVESKMASAISMPQQQHGLVTRCEGTSCFLCLLASLPVGRAATFLVATWEPLYCAFARVPGALLSGPPQLRAPRGHCQVGKF